MNMISTKYRRWLIAPFRIPAVRWGAGIGLIALTVFSLDPAEVLALLGDARWSIVFPVALALGAVHSVNAFAWKSMTGIATGLNILPGRALMLYYASLTIGLLTPSNIGSDVFRVKALASEQTRWQVLIAPIALQRATSFLSLGLLGVAGSFLLPVPTEIKFSVLGLVAFLTVTIGVYVWLSRRSLDRFKSIRRLMILEHVDTGADRSGQIGSVLSIGVVAGIVSHAISILLTLGLVAATGIDISPVSALAAIAIMRTSILVPFSVNGLGVQESAAAFIFPAAGMPAETGVAISLLSRIGLLITLGLGAASLARMGATDRNTRVSHVTEGGHGVGT